jgi:GT2 family glycosyltransferase
MSEDPGLSHDPLISVIVLNYNGLSFLPGCFATLSECDYPNKELILLDNNSTDESVNFTKTNYPSVKIIQTGSNGGYSRAYNIAFETAKGKYFVLLNNDVKVSKNWLRPLVKIAENDTKICALQPKIRSMVDDGYFEYAGASGGCMDKYGYPFLRGRVFYTIEKDLGQYDDCCDIFWTSGAAMFVRADALAQSGTLDESFVHHMEEIDLCWRLSMSGYRLKVVPDSTIYHHAGATIQAESFKKLYWNHRNGIFILLKNYSVVSLFKIMPFRILLDFINFFYSLSKLDFKHSYAIVKSHLWILFNLRLILQKRREVQKKRIIPDSDLAHIFYQGSIILEYFLRRKKTFKEIMGS